MTISLIHSFVSTVPDDNVPGELGPSDWNAEHVLTQATSTVLGRISAGTGATEELSATDVFNLIDGVDTWLKNVVEDTTPQLGGNLDVNGFTIGTVSLPAALSLGAADLTGDFTLAHLFDFGSSADPALELTSTGPNEGPALVFYHNHNGSTFPAFIYSYGKSSTGVIRQFGNVGWEVIDSTNASEDTRFEAGIMTGGASLTALTLGAASFSGTETTHTFDFSSSDTPSFVLQNSSTGTGGPIIRFWQNSASPAANDAVGGMIFYGNDSLGGFQTYGSFDCTIVDPTSASEDSKLDFGVYSSGSFVTALTLGTTDPIPDGFGLSHVFNFGSSNYPALFIKNTSAGTGGPYINAFADSASPAAGDDLFYNNAYGRDSAANAQYYGQAGWKIVDPTSTSEDSSYRVEIQSGGSILTTLTLGGADLFGLSPAALIDLGSSGAGSALQVKSSDPGGDGPNLMTYHASASPAAADNVGSLYMVGKDSAANDQIYARLRGVIVDATSTSEDSSFEMAIQYAGSTLTALTLGHQNTGGGGGYTGHRLDLSSNTGIHSFDVATPGIPVVTQYCTTQGATSYIGNQWFRGLNSLGSSINYVEIDTNVTDATSGSEDSQLESYVMSAGVQLQALTLGLADPPSQGFGLGAKFDSGSSDYGNLTLVGSSAAVGGPCLVLEHNSASPAAGDQQALYCYSKTSTGATYQSGYILNTVLDATNGSTDSMWEFLLASGGAGINALTLGTTDDKDGNRAHVFDLGTPSTGTMVEIKSANAGNTGVDLTLYQNSASPAANDYPGQLLFWGKNTTPAVVEYGAISCAVVDTTAASEDSRLEFYIQMAGTETAALTLGTTDFASTVGSHVFDFGAVTGPDFVIQGTGADSNAGPWLILRHDSASPAANDHVGALSFYGRDSLANNQEYGRIVMDIGDTTSGSADSNLNFYVRAGGSDLAALVIDPNSSLYQMDYGSIDGPLLRLITSSAGVNGPTLDMRQQSASPAASDVVGGISFNGKDSAANNQFYGDIRCLIVDPTSTSEDSELDFRIEAGGAQLSALTLGGLTTSGGANFGHLFSAGAQKAIIEHKSSNAGSTGAYIQFYQDSASPAASDELGGAEFFGRDSAANNQFYGGAYMSIVDTTSTSEDSKYRVDITSAGATLTAMTLGGADVIGGVSHIFDVGTGALAGIQVQNSSAGNAGPEIYLYQNSASPAASDQIATIGFVGKDSAANIQEYGALAFTITDATSTSEDARYDFYTIVAGTEASRLSIGGGLYNSGATGTDKGAGTLNMTAGVYENGVRVTPGCWGCTTGGGAPSLTTGSHNITSITDTATGRLTVTIATDFADANYCAVFGGTTTNSTTASRILAVNTKAAGSFEIDSYSAVTPTLADIIVGFDWACFGNRV